MQAPPGDRLDLAPATFGRYEVVLEGSLRVDGELVAPPGLRFVRGDDPPDPVVAGPDGVTLALLSFDQDALEGGLSGEGIAVAAAEALARAI
jgi:hypothetical protein